MSPTPSAPSAPTSPPSPSLISESTDHVSPLPSASQPRAPPRAPSASVRATSFRRKFANSRRLSASTSNIDTNSSRRRPGKPEVRRMSSSIRRWFGRSSRGTTSDQAFTEASQFKKVTLMNDLSGIPLREGLQMLYKVKRDKFLSEMCVFLIFFSVFVAIILEAYPVHTAFVQDDALMQRLIDEEFPGSSFKKNFAELETMEDYWSWVQGPLLNGMYETAWYNGDPYSEDDLGYVQSYDRLVGPIQLRQLRVGNESCSNRRFTQFGSRYDTKDGTCYAEFHTGSLFAPATEDKKPFGPPEDPARYSWTGGHGILWGLYGFGSQDYGEGGYITYLPPDAAGAQAVVNQLFADRWVDKGTRCISHTMNMYNTNTRLLTVARVVVEFFPSGFIQGSYSFFSPRLVLYHSKLGLLRGCLEVIFLLLWCYQFQKEIKRIMWTRPHHTYFLMPRNLFEVCFLSGNLGLIITWSKYIANPLRSSFDVNAETYVDFFPMAYDFIITFSFAAMTALLSCLKLFKFLSINKRMSTLWITLQRALYDLTLFLVGVVVIIVGFGVAAHLMFGYQLRDFHSIPASISSLTRFMLSDFNYEDLALVRPLMAPVFFWLYNAVVFLVVMNMFIAIVTLYFEEVHRDAKLSDKWKEGMPDLTYDVIKSCRRFGRNYCKKRCYCCYYIGRCSCLRGKPYDSRRGSGGKPRSVSGLDLQMEVWEREATFESLVREAARAAKRRHLSVDLFNYFEHAFREASGTSNYYVGLEELCMITRDTASCDHEDCLARALVLAYSNLKEVVLLRGEERTGTASFASRQTARFWVTKINKWGRKQERILAIDTDRQEIHGFDTAMNLKRVIPLSALVQVDKSVPDQRRLILVFAESVASQYHLLFGNSKERKDFVVKLFQAMNAGMSDVLEEEAPKQGGESKASPMPSLSSSSSPSSPSKGVHPEYGSLGGSGIGGGAGAAADVSTAAELVRLRRAIVELQRSMSNVGTHVRRQSQVLLPASKPLDDDW